MKNKKINCGVGNIEQLLINKLHKKMFSKNDSKFSDKMLLLRELQDRYNFLVETSQGIVIDNTGKEWDFDLTKSINMYEELIKKIVEL